ncbi:MAG: tol-pal system protein YbgF [Stellaceae bacterium]
MLGRPILAHARSISLFVLLAMTVAPVALAQDATTQERLDRLERDLSMLQRQVYRGTDGEAPAGAEGGDAAVDLQVRMDRLEQQMRDLTGRVEDETNAVQQLRQRIEQINSDIDVRLSQGQGQQTGPVAGPPPRGAAIAAGEPSDGPAPEPPPYGRRPPADTLAPPGQTASFGALRPPSGRERPYPGPADLTPPENGGSGGSLRPPGGDALPSGSASAQYNAAFGLLRRADYPAAEDALRSFVARHPNDPLAGNAQYWLGESFYARGQYTEAAAAFADGYKRYPRGAKATDGLLQLAMSLAHANQKHNACIALMQLDHDFPHQGSAVRSRATQEKKRLGC